MKKKAMEKTLAGIDIMCKQKEGCAGMKKKAMKKMFVYLINDEKYGTLGVFATKELADAECATGKYDEGGAPTYVERVRVENSPIFSRKKKQKDAQA